MNRLISPNLWIGLIFAGALSAGCAADTTGQGSDDVITEKPKASPQLTFHLAGTSCSGARPSDWIRVESEDFGYKHVKVVYERGLCAPTDPDGTYKPELLRSEWNLELQGESCVPGETLCQYAHPYDPELTIAFEIVPPRAGEAGGPSKNGELVFRTGYYAFRTFEGDDGKGRATMTVQGTSCSGARPSAWFNVIDASEPGEAAFQRAFASREYGLCAPTDPEGTYRPQMVAMFGRMESLEAGCELGKTDCVYGWHEGASQGVHFEVRPSDYEGQGMVTEHFQYASLVTHKD